MADDQSISPTETQSLAALEERPHARVFDGEPKTIRLALEGRVSIALGDDEIDVAAGAVARFDGAQDISPMARTDVTALLVLAPRAE